MARLTDVLQHEHGELLAQLDRCLSPTGELNLRAYEEFRRRQLRHVAIEEKVLLPALARRKKLSAAFQNALHKDHEAIVVLCVTAPNPDFVRDLKELIAWHQKVEEEPNGFYDLFDRHVGDDPQVSEALAHLPPISPPPFASGEEVAQVLRQVLRELGLAAEESPAHR